MGRLLAGLAVSPVEGISPDGWNVVAKVDTRHALDPIVMGRLPAEANCLG